MTAAEGADAIVVAGAPQIPGLVLRRWRAAGDEAAIAALHNRCYETDRIPIRETTEDIANDLRHLVGFDPAQDLVLGELDGRLVLEARTNRLPKLDGTVTLRSMCWIDPVVRGRGLGRAILRHQEVRLRAATLLADPPYAPRHYRTFNAQTEVTGIALVESEGYRHVRTFFEMECNLEGDLPERLLPAGLEVRPVPDEATARVALAADNEAFRDHWGHRELTDDDIAGFLARPDQDLTLWMVGWDGAEVVGLVVPTIRAAENAMLGRRRGWLDTVATRRPWRGRGLATALMARSMAALQARGMTTAGLGVDSENPTGALAIYERLGFSVTQRYLAFDKPFEAA